jgi:hypothetical protein
MLSARRLITMRRLNVPAVRNFARSVTGMQDYKFDYHFESKIDHGNYPPNTGVYMKTLGEDFDTDSADYHNNFDEMAALNLELDYMVENN